jgi:hypothetical protein
MTDDDVWYKPNGPKSAPRLPKPGERVWSLVKDGRRLDCELRFQGESYGWECQVLEDGVLRFGSRFPSHAGAVAEAEAKRERLLRNRWAVYNESPSWLRNAQAALNDAVFTAYGWPHDLPDGEVRHRLLRLNVDRTKVTPPGAE